MSAIKWVLIFKKLLNRAIFCWIPTRKCRAKVNFKNTFFTTFYFNENSLEFLFDFLQSITQMQLPYPFNLITLHFITIQTTKILMKKNAISIGDNHVLHLLWRCQYDSLTYLFGVFTRSQNKCHCLASASSFHAHIIAALHCEKFDCIELKSRASADLRCAVLTWPQST